MSWRSTLTVAVVVGAAAFAAGRGWSEDEKGGMPSKEEMEKMMADMAAPAEEHKKLAANAGIWDGEMTMKEPGAEPKTEKGVVTMKTALGGLYVVSEHKMTMDGKPFEGIGVDGYSKEKKKYFTFWADQMGSTPMLLWGTPDATGKVITYDGDAYDCGPMGQMTPRTKVTFVDADHYTFEFWAKMGDSSEYVNFMEGKFTRRK